MNVARHNGWLNVLAVVICFCATSIGATTNFVTNTNDTGPGSLREMLNLTPAASTISLAITGTITLTSGQLDINRTMFIRGPGADNLSIAANGLSRVLHIAPSAMVELVGVHVTGGVSGNGSNAVQIGETGRPAPGGGGILNEGILFLRDCMLSGNSTGNGGNGSGTQGVGGSGGPGGGFLNLNQAVVTNCLFTDNQTGIGGFGGGGSPGSFVPDGFPTPAGSGANGGAGGNGAAIFNRGALHVWNCVFSNNVPGSGGGGGAAGPMGYSGGYGPGWPGTNGYGGQGGSAALWNEEGTVELRDCVFSQNGGGTGGRQNFPYRVFPYPGGSIYSSAGAGGDGAALGNRGTALVFGSTFIRNNAGTGGPGREGVSGSEPPSGGGPGGNGGAVFNAGTLRIYTSLFSGNAGGTGGAGGLPGTQSYGGSGGTGGVAGAIFSLSGDVEIADTVFDRNSGGAGGISGSGTSFGRGGDAGAMFTGGITTITNSSFTHHESAMGSFYGYGGAILNRGTLTLSTCTISSNVCGGFGGGIYTWGPLEIVSCTIVSNRSYNYGAGISGFGYTTLRNSIVTRNDGAYDLYGSFLSRGFNWIGRADRFIAAGDVVSTNDPMLGPLVTSATGSLYHPPLMESPLINAGDNSLDGTDQRGLPRRSGGRVDIGACELQVPAVLSVLSFGKEPGGGFRIIAPDTGDVRVLVVGSTDLTAPRSWVPLGYLRNGPDGLSTFVDVNAPLLPRRYYQLKIE